MSILRGVDTKVGTMRVVIGAGADALRAAAVLASTGVPVLLLQECDTPHGLAHPDVAEGMGRVYVSAALRELAERSLGPLVEAPSMKRAISLGDKVHAIPMSLGAVPTLFEGPALSAAGRSFFMRRVRNALIPLTGEGQEERNYRQWVERRMGAFTYQQIYSDYAHRRWGLDGGELSVAVARAHHNPHRDGPGQVPGGGPEASLSHAVSLIEANGGEIRCGVTVRGLKVVDGKVVAVRVGRKHIKIDEPLWVARPHSVVAGWLGEDLPTSRHVDARALQVWDRVQIAFPVETGIVHDEIHVLDKAAPAWRVSQLYGGSKVVVFHSSLAPDAPTPSPESMVSVGMNLGLSGLDPKNAKVERLREWVPLWAPVVHPRLRRLALAWSDLGLVGVGRRGTFTPIDMGTEVAVAANYSSDEGDDGREVLRALLEPPVKDDDLNASFRDFIWC